MDDLVKKLIVLIDEFDSFGTLDRKVPLLGIAIGTLRKDRDIAHDIVELNENSHSGLGSMALARILIEDYFNLRFLNYDKDNLDSNIDLFNTHPSIDHYGSMRSMLNWGYPFGEDEKLIFPQIEAGFEKNKDKFLRRGKKHDPYVQDNYYRTWNKMSLEELISKSGFVEEDLRTLHFLNEHYNTGSSVIHHNAFNIWFLATQGRDNDLINQGYREISIRVTFDVLQRLLNLVINIYSSETKNEESALHFILELEKILDEFIALKK